MLALASLTIFSCFASSILAAPTKIPIITVAGDKKPGSYIVKLKDGSKKEDVMAWLNPHLSSDNSTMTFDYDSSPESFNAFSGEFSASVLDALATNPNVEYISEDGIFTTTKTQKDATWGLRRISDPKKIVNGNPYALDYKYKYDTKAGKGVDVFVLDTGIFIDHSEFEGRASWGYSAFGGNPQDGHGHGTHVSGTIAGRQYGVAKKANLIAVKVLSDGGSGSTSGIIAGINYVIKRCKKSSSPCVINMSLGGGVDKVLDQGVDAAISAGIHVVVSAGNSAEDAKYQSPARAEKVITVGASTINDAVASFSNFGSVVDIFAPGVNVISSWIGSADATNTISGTSMAAPHVAGVAASLLSIHGQHTPADLTFLIKGHAVNGILTGVPASTVNSLVQILK